jgi:hypothetical protein
MCARQSEASQVHTAQRKSATWIIPSYADENQTLASTNDDSARPSLGTVGTSEEILRFVRAQAPKLFMASFHTKIDASNSNWVRSQEEFANEREQPSHEQASRYNNPNTPPIYAMAYQAVQANMSFWRWKRISGSMQHATTEVLTTYSA